MSPRTFNHESETHVESPMICKYCGAKDSVIALYSERVYGRATVLNREIELGDCETDDGDDFEIHQFRCYECGEEENDIENLILPEGDVFQEEQEEEQEEEE